MRIAEDQKEKVLTRLQELSDTCFSGVEKPTPLQFHEMVKTSDVFVIQRDGLILGFALLTYKNDEPYIWSIAVDQKYRNCGLASRMIEEMGSYVRARRETTLTLTVNVNNPAQKVYFDNGFRVTAFSPHYYYSAGDGLLMRRVL